MYPYSGTARASMPLLSLDTEGFVCILFKKENCVYRGLRSENNLFVPTNTIKLKSLFFCLNAVISGNTGLNCKIIFCYMVHLSRKAVGYIALHYA